MLRIFLYGICFLFAGASAQGKPGSLFFRKAAPYQKKIETLLQKAAADSVRLYCEQILAEEKRKTSRKRAVAYFYLGKAALLEGDLTEAKNRLGESLLLFQQQSDEESVAVTQSELGDLALLNYEENQIAQAKTFFDQAQILAEKHKLSQVLYKIYYRKATVIHSDDMKLVVNFLHRALSAAAQLQDTAKILQIYDQLANRHRSVNEGDSTEIYYSKQSVILQNQGDSSFMQSLYTSWGRFYLDLGRYAEAQNKLFEALALAEKSGEDYSLMGLRTDISKVFLAIGLWEEAYKNIEISLSLAQKLGVEQTQADNLRDQAFILQKLNRPEEAAQKYLQALDIYENLDNVLEAGAIMIALSDVYKNGGDLKKANSLLEQASVLLDEALKIRETINRPLNVIQYKLLLGKVEIKRNSNRRAIQLLSECIDVALEKDSKADLKEAYALLAEAYRQNGQYKLALESFQNFHSVDTSILSTKNAERIQQLEERHKNAQLNDSLAQQRILFVQQNLDLNRTQNQNRWLLAGIAGALLLTLFLYYVYYQNNQLHQQKINLLRAEQETERLTAIIEGEEKERRRIGRELHDGLGAVLATAKMQLNALRHKKPDLEESPAYQKAEQLIDAACENVREVSHDLMPGVLEQQGLEFALEDMCQSMSRASDLEVSFIPYGLETPLKDEVNVTIYRIVQELLKNAVKHAEAKEIIVQLTIEDGLLNLVVEDDGKGFDTTAKGRSNGIGLNNIRTRVAYLNGRLNIDSQAGQGSTFTVEIPLKVEESRS